LGAGAGEGNRTLVV